MNQEQQPSPYSEMNRGSFTGALHRELHGIYLQLGKLEHDTLLAKARLANRANEILNQIAGER
jgi:hypothetical protein